MADPTTITEAIDQTAVEGVQSATVDGRTATAVPIPDLIAADKYQRSRSALDGTGPGGGAVSAWSRTRPAKVVPPGAC